MHIEESDFEEYLEDSDVLEVYNVDTEKRTIIEKGSCRNADPFFASDNKGSCRNADLFAVMYRN